MSDDIILDEPADETTPLPVKSKSATPAWMVIAVLVAFACLVGTLTLQFMEYRYLRGGGQSSSDPYAAPAVLPSA